MSTHVVFILPLMFGGWILQLGVCRAWVRIATVAYISQTIPSPSPSLALGTIAFGNPWPPPWLPCTLSSSASSASSHDPYTVFSGSAVGLCSPTLTPITSRVSTSKSGGSSHVPSMSITISDSTGVMVRPQLSFISAQSVA